MKNPLSIGAIISTISVQPLIAVATQATEQLNTFSLGYSQNTTDYFAENGSEILPTSLSFSFSRQLSENLTLSASHDKLSGSARWPVYFGERKIGEETAKINSKNYGLSALWQEEYYGLALSYSQTNNQDNARTLLPEIIEVSKSDAQLASVSYNRFFEIDQQDSAAQWIVNWNLGSQYANFDIKVVDETVREPLTTLTIRDKQTIISGYVDIGVSYWDFEGEISWMPYAEISWNWELSSDNEQFATLSRGEATRAFDLTSERFSNRFRNPDTGRAEIGIALGWQNGWDVDLSYHQNIASELSLNGFSLIVSASF
ncbi:MAG: hypothetical protein KUG78_21045 [Kangiellaceae bacterium]|nr:hypothetical protein [Kangiellaceae bacterium]